MEQSVKLQNGCLYIDGKATVLLCSSLFYFRIPAEYWQARMRQLKDAGYNAIDVYFPWNFHETEPDVWNFEGMRDVDRFLALAAQEGLYVVARPGPYICSEWDGGGMPAWLSERVGSALRQHDDRYLGELRKWMDRMMPIISRRQHGREGSVVLVQLENELDLFPCEHPRRFVGELARMADEHHFHIPYIACSGSQLDVEMAGGTADGVNPTYNFYPAPDHPAFEEQMRMCYEVMRRHSGTFMTTETNREHRTLRREVASGLRLISPYCQTASHDYDCYTGISSWGNNPEHPIAYMTNDYDHGAMLTADGCVTEEYLEARLLANLLQTFGVKIAEGTPFADHGVAIEVDFSTNIDGFHGMRLSGDGYLVCIPNLGETEGRALIASKEASFRVPVAAKQTLLLPFALPLDSWGIAGAVMEWSSYEIAWIEQKANETKMVLYGAGDGVCLALLDGEKKHIINSTSWHMGGRQITIEILPREEAARSESPFLPPFEQEMVKEFAPNRIVQLEKAVSFSYPRKTAARPIKTLEKLGVYRGLGLYQVEIPPCQKVLLKGAGDILHVSQGERRLYSGCTTGGHLWIEARGGSLEVQAEIWGHSCFDAIQYPVLRMGSQKGLSAIYAIQQEIDIAYNWCYHPDSGEWGPLFKAIFPEYPAIMDYGVRMPYQPREVGAYRKEVLMPREGDTRILWMKGCKTPTCVYVDGRRIGEVDPGDPYLDITRFTKAGRPAELVVSTIKTLPYDPTGKPVLLSATSVSACLFAPLAAEELPKLALGKLEACTLPQPIIQGAVAAFQAHIPKSEKRQWIRFEGQRIKVTAIHNRHVLGRFFVDCEMEQVVVSGDPERAWLPGAWIQEDGNVVLLVEAMAEDAVLEAVHFDER